MLEKSENTISKPLMSSVGDSPARTFHNSTIKDLGLKESDQGYGVNITESFASYDRDTYSLKTSQPLLMADWRESSVTFSGGGMMRNGRLYERPQLDCHTPERDFLLLPTCRASDPFRMRFSKQSVLKTCLRERGEIALPYVLILLDVPFQKYPNIYAWMMGAPMNYLKLKTQSQGSETVLLCPSPSGSEKE